MEMNWKKWVQLLACILVMIMSAVAGHLSKDWKAEVWNREKLESDYEEKLGDKTGEKECGSVEKVQNGEQKTRGITIMIDSGHGGYDPGKISCIEGVLEKDINLAIAMKLEAELKAQGFTVCMTRDKDIALCEEGSTHKKRDDMAKRIALINESGAAFCISIHQNSFTQAGQKGAQVFYYAGSGEGKNLASYLQKSIKDALKDGNRREAKENNNYYLLLHTDCPAVIVECGFLSNPEETRLLMDEAYQQKLVEAITDGVLKYCENTA